MSPRDINILLWVLAMLLLGIGIAELLFMDCSAGGLGSIAVGMSLVAVAAATRKKIKNG